MVPTAASTAVRPASSTAMSAAIMAAAVSPAASISMAIIAVTIAATIAAIVIVSVVVALIVTIELELGTKPDSVVKSRTYPNARSCIVDDIWGSVVIIIIAPLICCVHVCFIAPYR